MNSPLIDNKDSIEFSIRNSGRGKSQIIYDIPPIAQIQLFDVSQDFDPLFQKEIPQTILSKEVEAFRAEKQLNCFEQVMKIIPVFHPESTGLLLWQLLVVIIIFTYLFYIPFKIAFTDEANGNNPQNTPGVIDYLIFSIVTLGIDLLVSFNSGIKKQGEVILDRKVIAEKYIIWEFELDFIGVLSLLLSLVLQNDYIRLLFYLRSYYVIRFSDKIDNSLQLRSNWKAAYTVIKLIIVVLFVNHLMACFFFGVSYSEYEMDSKGQSNLPTWIQYNGYVEDGQTIAKLDIWSRYVVSFYWATTTVSTVGYGDITPKNDYEIGITLMTMIIAGMVFAFNVASIRDVIVEMNAQDIRYNNYEAVINRYMKIKNISMKTQARIIDYYQYIWQDEKNRNRPIEQLLINKLAPELREQLQYETYLGFVRCRLFWNINFSQDFIRSLVEFMEEENYGPGEIVKFEDNQNDNYLMYLQNGEILIYVESNHNDIDIKTRIEFITKGQCFGQFSFFTGEKFQFIAQTQQNCNVYKIAKSKFLSQLNQYSQDFEIYHLLLTKRYSDEQEFYGKLQLECYTCNTETHQADKCDVTHYYPKHILKNIRMKDDKQKREKYQRKTRKQFNSVFILRGIQQSVNTFNNNEKLFKRITMKHQQQENQNLLEEIEEEENQDEYQGNIGEIKFMLTLIMDKMGIKQESLFKPQNIFIPQKPKFDPYETSYEIDAVRNYEYFQPQYNIANIISRIFK